MDEQKFREGIDRILPTLKLFVAGFKDGGWSFINHLNSLDKNLIQKFYDEYNGYKVVEKINRVRRNILEKLLKGPITLDEANAIFNDEKQLWEKNQLGVWTIPRIVYPFCYGENRSEERHTREFLIELCNDVIDRAGYDRTKISDPGQVSFDGANNFGKNGFYVAFGNNTHPDYTTSDQFRIESKGDDKLRVGIYHHKKGFIEGQHKTFDLDIITLQDVIDEAKECKDIVENDIYKGPEKQNSSNQNITLPTSNKIMTSVSLNTILYGVPGTGKTYNSVNYAVAIIENKSFEKIKEEPYEEIKRRYDEYQKVGQIVFTTFHQSFGYEDFIEGIKAEIKNNSVNYDVKPGIFKKLCDTARKNLEDSQKTIDELTKQNNIIDNIRNLLNESIEKGTKYKIKSGAEFYIEEYNDENIYIRNPQNEKADSILLKFNDLISLLSYENKITSSGEIVNILGYYTYTRQSDSYLFSLYNEYNKRYSESKQNISSEAVERKNYVIIIDEINRGNISKIFGELITLIEPNKRLGEDEAMTVKLPYSHDKDEREFGIPNNVYILGTMNTADRSIALMDIALRRRFKFREIEPDSSLLDDIPSIEGINIKSLFETLNKRIEFLYDRDHLLGHAYFLPLKKDNSLDKLNSIILNNIVPLLQEYFHDDWEKIQLVLGEGIVKSEMMSAKELGINNSEYEDYPKYTINTQLSAQDYPH